MTDFSDLRLYKYPKSTQDVDIKGPTTAFGDLSVAQEEPIEQVLFTYGIGDKTETFLDTGGTVTFSDSLVNCNTTTSLGSYAVARTKRALIYRPGEGAGIKITAVFNTGVASSLQLAGLFSATDALCFGYNGTSFGILHRYGGALEIQELQITAAASGSETATVTLDGTGYSIPVTSGTVNHNAYEIGEYLIANQSAWKVEVVGDTVVLLAQSVGDKTGTFSISSTGTCAGTFTEVQAGAANTEDWTAQTSFNRDTVSWLDPQKGNVYKIVFQYLGFGNITFFVEDPDTGAFKLVHMIEYANSSTTPSMQNPSLKGGYALASLGSTTAMTLSGSSLELFIQGRIVKREEAHAYANTKSVTTAKTNIFSIRNRNTFDSVPNLAELKPLTLTATSESSKTTILEVYKNATIDGEPDFSYLNDTLQIAEVDTAGTTYTSTDGKLLTASAISNTGFTPTVDFEKLKGVILPGDTLSIVAYVTGGAASDVTVTLTWEEDL